MNWLKSRRSRVLLCTSGVSFMIMCGLAPTAAILNISRAFQGIGAGIQLSAALASLVMSFRVQKERGLLGFGVQFLV